MIKKNLIKNLTIKKWLSLNKNDFYKKYRLLSNAKRIKLISLAKKESKLLNIRIVKAWDASKNYDFSILTKKDEQKRQIASNLNSDLNDVQDFLEKRFGIGSKYYPSHNSFKTGEFIRPSVWTSGSKKIK